MAPSNSAKRPATLESEGERSPAQRTGRLRSFFRLLGPGLITGAADDDPSGISTYSQVGAAFGYTLLWTAGLTLPLMAAVQLMCARIGRVAKKGLASTLREHYQPWLLWLACGLLVVGNIINIAADLGGMAAATTLLIGVRAVWLVPVYTATITAFLLWSSYERMARVFKWLTLVLFAYVAASFLAHPDWREVLTGTFHVRIPHADDAALTIVAILGTTISPYLFFWQAAHEVEEEKALRRDLAGRRPRALARELQDVQWDVLTGMVFSNVVMYFIILTAGATLHVAGKTDVQTAAEAAAALEPLAGKGAALLFTLGLVGTGMLGVPVLAGSAAYGVAEAAAWRRGMAEKPRRARNFYGVIVAAMLGGMALALTHIAPIKLLFWAAVANGLLAPPLIIIILVVCNNRVIMRDFRNGPLLNALGGLAALAMTTAAGLLIASWLR
jgi:NRAMP (natural resistance-associated macrophage protein)-like metal ion transporter